MEILHFTVELCNCYNRKWFSSGVKKQLTKANPVKSKKKKKKLNKKQICWIMCAQVKLLAILLSYIRTSVFLYTHYIINVIYILLWKKVRFIWYLCWRKYWCKYRLFYFPDTFLFMQINIGFFIVLWIHLWPLIHLWKL